MNKLNVQFVHDDTNLLACSLNLSAREFGFKSTSTVTTYSLVTLHTYLYKYTSSSQRFVPKSIAIIQLLNLWVQTKQLTSFHTKKLFLRFFDFYET